MNAFDLSAALRLDTSQFDTSLSNASAGVTNFIGGLLKSFGVGQLAAAALGAAVGAFFVSSVKTGAEFDKAMSQVAATMGKSMSEMENDVGNATINANGKIIEFSGNLREFAQVMGENTAFSATECAEALNYMALAGYDTQQSMDMLPNVLNLAAAGNIDLARASDMVTDTQTAFGISTERTTQMVDEMAKAASTGNTSVEQLGDAFLIVGGLAKELNGGMVELADGTMKPVDGVQELEIALTAMANAGIKGSEAGTHMRNMLLKLSSPTAEGTKQMEALGVKVFDTDGKMRSLNDIFGDLNSSLSNLTQEQKIQAISELFNTRDIASAEALLGAVGQDWDKIGESILDAQGAAQKMAETQLDNLAGDVTLFKSALEGAQIALSDVLMPAIRKFVQFGTESLTNITKFVRENSDSIKSMLEGVATVISGVLEVVFVVLSKLFTFISEHSEGVKAAIIGIVTAFMTFKTITFVQGIIQGIISLFPVIFSALATLTTSIVATGSVIEGTMQAIGMSMITGPQAIIAGIAALVAIIGVLVYEIATQEEAVKSLDEATKNHEETLKNLASAQSSYFDATKALTDAQNELAKAQEETGLSGEDLYNQFQNGTLAYQDMNAEQQRVLEAYVDMTKKQQALKETTEELKKAQGEELVASFQQQASAIKENGGNWDELGAKMRKAYDEGKIGADELQELFGQAMTEMDSSSKATFVQNLPEDMRYATLMGVKEQETFGQKWEHFCSDIDTLFGETTDSVSQHSTDGYDNVTSTWQDIGNWFGDRWNDISNAFSGAADWFRDKFNEAKFAVNYTFAPVVQFFEDTWNSIKFTWGVVAGWFEDIINDARFRINYAFAPVIQFFEDTWNKIKFIWGVVASWFGGESENAEGNMESPWGKIGGFFGDKWNEIKDNFKIGDVFTWGSDMIENFINGIKSAWDRLKGTLEGIAQFIANIFKHTTPKEGPLKDDDEWTAHMMDNFIGGIDKNKGKLKKTMLSVADMMAEPMTMNVDGVFSGASGRGASGYNQTINVYSPKALTPYEVARQTRNATRNMVLSMQGV